MAQCYACEGQFAEGVEGVKDFSFVSDITCDDRETKRLMLSGKFSGEGQESVALCNVCAVQAIVTFAKELQESFQQSERENAEKG